MIEGVAMQKIGHGGQPLRPVFRRVHPPRAVLVDLIALFPLTLARLFEGFAAVRAFPSPVPLGEYHVTMAWHPRVKDDPAHQWLRSVIIETATGLDRVSIPA